MNLGYVGTWVAFAVAIAAGFCYLLAGAGRARIRPLADGLFLLQTGLLLGLVGWLWSLLLTHQFQYEYVASYTSRDLDRKYLFAALWGGQQGTFLLWATWTALLGSALLWSRNRLVPTAMFFLNWVQIFLLFILVIEGPFQLLARTPLDGQGLNPLLQDVWMTIHPPVLFLGYSSLVVPFALALATLCHRDTRAWLSIVPRWSLLSTVVLATGFTMGGIWAYKVLGWGGFWGWDPVENASFVPWLMNAALFHGLLVQRATGSLSRANLLLGVIPFWFVLYGSFLTRSGVLADFSVHSFVDLGLNSYLLSFLGVFVGTSLVMWAVRAPKIPAGPDWMSSVSREFGLWLGMLVFLLMGVLTMLGTSAPLVSRLLGPASNVRIDYYNVVNGLLAVLLSLLTGLAPLLRWRGDRAERVARTAVPPALAGVIAVGVAASLGVRGTLPLVLLGCAIFALVSNATITARALRRGPAFAAGYVSHLGVAVFLVGVIALSQYGRQLPVELPLGQPKSAFGFEFTYRGLTTPADGKTRARIAVRGGRGEFEALPPIYFSEFNQSVMRAPHVERFWDRDLYISPIEVLAADRGAPGFPLAKGQSREVGDARFTFVDFGMQRTDKEVRASAEILVERDGTAERVRPAVVVSEYGRTSVPADFGGGGAVSLASVDADGGTIELTVRVPGQPSVPEALAVEISTKPLIGLVWAGVSVMLIGILLAIARRSRGPGSLPPITA
jgi:cytochrome c-type biogenesis protein CcmF